jgi:DNA-binding GntR family transcriptional regulator
MLKQAILQGELAPSQPLVENDLAEWCQVSRTPIREALTRLEQDGLIERADRGLIVRERSPEDILDIYETRIALEATVARVAAERRTEYDLRSMRRVLDQSRATSRGNVDRVELNRQFHRTIWVASHNESLIDLLERLNLHLARYPATTLSFPGRWKQALDEHQALVDAIEHRDGARASSVALTHFTEARDIRIKLWDVPG